jgi:hypothetical protein
VSISYLNELIEWYVLKQNFLNVYFKMLSLAQTV